MVAHESLKVLAWCLFTNLILIPSLGSNTGTRVLASSDFESNLRKLTGDACERLGCRDPAPPSVVLGTTSFHIVHQPTSIPLPRTVILTGDAGDVEHVIGGGGGSHESLELEYPYGFPGATLEAIRVQDGTTTATFVTSDETTFLVPTSQLGATAGWDVVSNTVTHIAGPGYSVVFATPTLVFGTPTHLAPGATKTKTSVVTVTKTATSTLESVKTVVQVSTQEPSISTTTHFVTLEPSTTTTTSTWTSTSIATSTAIETQSVSYCPVPSPLPTPPCNAHRIVVPWTTLSVPSPQQLRKASSSSSYSSFGQSLDTGMIPLNYPHDVLIRVIDAGYRAETYAISIPRDDEGDSTMPNTFADQGNGGQGQDQGAELEIEGRRLGFTQSLSEDDLAMGVHIHCGTNSGEETVRKCIELGFSEGTFHVAAGTQAIRVSMAYSARHDDYSTILYTVSPFCH